MQLRDILRHRTQQN